jgi:hypothetical protein
MKALERANAELRRANAILRTGVGFLRVNAILSAARHGSLVLCCLAVRWLVLDVRPRRAPRTRGVRGLIGACRRARLRRAPLRAARTSCRFGREELPRHGHDRQ